MRQCHPRIATYDDYKAMFAERSPTFYSMCLQKEGASPHILIVCGQGYPNVFRLKSNKILDQAILQTNVTAVIDVKFYRKSGFRKTKVGRFRLIAPQFVATILADYFVFQRHHYDVVYSQLELMSLPNDSDFDVIHWQAEIPDLLHNA